MAPGLTAVKTLFALSCNRCAFPGCDERLADPNWRQVKADIAHICGEKLGAARYDPEMTAAERDAYENLVLLCPNHHREIDRLRPQDHSVEALRQMKAKHEGECGHKTWTDDSELEYYAGLALQALAPADDGSRVGPRPRLTFEDGEGDSFYLANVGDDDALNISAINIVEDSRGILRISDDPPRRISPGGRWRAGMIAHTLGGGGKGEPVLLVTWQGPDGTSYDAEFPLG